MGQRRKVMALWVSGGTWIYRQLAPQGHHMMEATAEPDSPGRDPGLSLMWTTGVVMVAE